MIKVREFTSKEVCDWQDRKYNEFLDYYNNTTHTVKQILQDDLRINQNCSTSRYIRKRLRHEGLNTNKRHELIKKGKWIC